MLIPCYFIEATPNKSATGSDDLRDFSGRQSAVQFDSIAQDQQNLLFNDAYFEFYRSIDLTAYQYNEDTGQLVKRSILSWRNYTGNRELTQADLDKLLDPPTGRVLKTKEDKYISVLDSTGCRQTLQVNFDITPKTPPLFVDLIKNGRDWMTVNEKALVVKKAPAISNQGIFTADGNLVRCLMAVIGGTYGGGGYDYVGVAG